jgi:tetratricopeptide (TPR) repeat protein
MTFNRNGLALLLASSGLALATPAFAQYGASAPKPQTAAPASGQAAAQDSSGYKPNISNAARKEIVDLQTAVNAKDTANIPAKVAAALAKAKSNDDKYVIGKLQLKAAVDANDTNAMTQAIETIIGSGAAPDVEQISLYTNLGKLQYNAKSYDSASKSLEQVLQRDPANVDAIVTLAETRNAQGRAAEGVGLIQKAIAAKVAAGQKPDENWYKRAVKLSFDAKMPTAPDIAREWVAAYPTPKNWRDAIRIYHQSSQLDDAALIDTMRLARVTGALQGENDYFRYTNTLVTKGFPGEAKAVLDQGFAAKAIDKSRATFSQLYSLASTRSQGDQASLAATASAAKAAPDAKKAMVTAEAYYGYGDYQQAADLFRTALTKNGADKDVANLRLGMALAQAGDKAGAEAALKAVGGAQAGTAKLWLTYLQTKG